MSFQIKFSEEIAYRHDFALLAEARGYRDAVEVGVDQGVFAKGFLDRWKGNWLLLVDPYRPYPEMPYDRTPDLMTAVQALTPHHHGRFRFIRQPSPAAVSSVLRFIKAPEFVYLDGAHDEVSIITDLLAWWDVLPPHGMLAGHDFDDLHPDVKAAVKGFARGRDLTVRLTREMDSPPSWYVYKTEPDVLHIRLFINGVETNRGDAEFTEKKIN